MRCPDTSKNWSARVWRKGDTRVVTNDGERWVNYSLLERKISPEPNSGCWLWTGYCDPDGGYAKVGPSWPDTYVHRLMFTIFFGPIPPDLEIDHKCRVRCCVNPKHLEAVTHLVNMGRARNVGRPRLHPVRIVPLRPVGRPRSIRHIVDYPQCACASCRASRSQKAKAS